MPARIKDEFSDLPNFWQRRYARSKRDGLCITCLKPKGIGKRMRCTKCGARNSRLALQSQARREWLAASKPVLDELRCLIQAWMAQPIVKSPFLRETAVRILDETIGGANE